jgi:hypothetical protein
MKTISPFDLLNKKPARRTSVRAILSKKELKQQYALAELLVQASKGDTETF